MNRHLTGCMIRAQRHTLASSRPHDPSTMRATTPRGRGEAICDVTKRNVACFMIPEALPYLGDSLHTELPRVIRFEQCSESAGRSVRFIVSRA